MNLDLFCNCCKKIDTPTDFAYNVGKIRSIYQNERLEKRISIPLGFTRWSFIRIGKFQKSKKLFQKEESRKIQTIKKIKKFKNSKKDTEMYYKEDCWLFLTFWFFWIFLNCLDFFGYFWVFLIFLDFFENFQIVLDFFSFFGFLKILRFFWIFWKN